MPSQGIKVAFGTAPMGNNDPWKTDEQIEEAFKILEKHKVDILDTAQLYGNSENRIGEVKGGSRFTIDTKWIGGWAPGKITKDGIIDTTKESLSRLGVKKVDIFYIHAPDSTVPLEDTLAGVNEAYKSGAFERFGLSNYPASEVQKVYDICKANNYVLPTAYQGNYSPVARKQETILFPTLRKLGISFYAYSPLAGGFLTKTKEDIEAGAGRFNKETIGGMYADMYAKPSYIGILPKWAKIAEDVGCSKAELAYRWVTYNCPLKRENGDAIILGASSHKQLDQTLTGLENGPLPESAVKGIDDIWEVIKDDAPTDNYTR